MEGWTGEAAVVVVVVVVEARLACNRMIGQTRGTHSASEPHGSNYGYNDPNTQKRAFMDSNVIIRKATDIAPKRRMTFRIDEGVA